MTGFCQFLVGDDLNFLIGKVQKILLATSVYGKHLLLTGLYQDMLHEEVLLRLKDILMAAGNSYNNIQKQV